MHGFPQQHVLNLICLINNLICLINNIMSQNLAHNLMNPVEMQGDMFKFIEQIQSGLERGEPPSRVFLSFCDLAVRGGSIFLFGGTLR